MEWEKGDTTPGAVLKNLKNGDVIEVKGEVDPVIKDPLGKPVYLVSHVNTITKAPTQESQ